MAYRITLIPGDGIGPEVTEATRRVLEATGVVFDWEIAYAGADIMDKYGTPLPESVLDSIRKNRVALKGPITTPVGHGFRSVNVAMRKTLDLQAESAVMGAEGAAAIIHRQEIKTAKDLQAKGTEKIEEYRQLFYNPYIAASQGYINAVVPPQDTRPKIIAALEALLNKKESRPARKHGNIPM